MINLDAAAATDPGRQREVNEDRVWSQVYQTSDGQAVGLFMVCDGMGGHLAGECASHWAVETVRRRLADLFVPANPAATIKLSSEEMEAALVGGGLTRKAPVSALEERVRAVVEEANRVVYGYARQKPEEAGGAGTTLTLALVKGSRAVIANVGDSRTYLLRDGRLRQITEDHSLVASLVAAGQLKPEEIYFHPQRNVIYRSLGQKNKAQVDTFQETLQPGDYLLLCSDGLWEMVQDARLVIRLLQSSCEPGEACQKLIEAANQAGGEDNIGVVVVKVV